MIGDIDTEEGEKAACAINNEFGKNKAIFAKTDATKVEDVTSN